MSIAKLISFIKETIAGTFKAATSKERLKSLYGICLCCNAVSKESLQSVVNSRNPQLKTLDSGLMTIDCGPGFFF